MQIYQKFDLKIIIPYFFRGSLIKNQKKQRLQ